MATTASSLEPKSYAESNKLKHKLRNQLNADIFKLYSQSIFADIYINFESNEIRSHRCILQTRVPTFYNTYCNRPDLITCVPVQELKIFIREVYCESEIEQREKKLLKYIDSFLTGKNSNLSFNAQPNTTHSKQRIQNEIHKINALNAYGINRVHFRSNSDNSVYYSLVDRSLILSDYSDINEEYSEMSSCLERVELPSAEKIHRNVEPEEIVEEQITCKQEENIQASPIAKNVSIRDLEAPVEVRNADTKCQKKDKVFKCFIDASDLIDESGNNSEVFDLLPKLESKADGGQTPALEEMPDSLDKPNIDIHDGTTNSHFVQHENVNTEKLGNISAAAAADQVRSPTNESKQIFDEACIQVSLTNICDDSGSRVDYSLKPSELDGNVQSSKNEEQLVCPLKADSSCGSRPKNKFTGDSKKIKQSTVNSQKLAKSCGIRSETESDLRDQLTKSVPDDMNMQLGLDTRVQFTEHARTPVVVENTLPDLTTVSHQNASLSDVEQRESFALFKSHLILKYECAKSNHEYLNSELERLKIFDELLRNDTEFRFLKHNLEEVLSHESPSKTEVAMHKFLTKQCEKKHGTERTLSFMRSLMLDMLKMKPASQQVDITDEATIDDLLKKLLSSKTFASKKETKKFESLRKSVTNSRSCGFFIDLNETTKPEVDTKEKILPPKQLFSMFIDFGNSTDSDSSIEVQNKFERRKKQYISKMEKSRDLRNSVTSLSDVDENRRLENISQNVPEKIQQCLKTPSNVVRRSKNTTSDWKEMRRSWNVDETNEINPFTMSRHKRSYSVSEKNPLNDDDTPKTDVNLNKEITTELPSIGNANSTNASTVNGESEISNSVSYSEQEIESVAISTSSNSKTYPKSPRNSDDNTEKIVEKSFVKLSDMDKELKTTTFSERWSAIRMTKSVTSAESSWLETKFLNGSANSRSLSRIFPDLSASVLSKPNSDVDYTTVSSMSSFNSSSVMSTCESNLDESNTMNKTDSNTLGQDLLRMFLDEISTDVVVEVAGRRIKAHKCILTSRCQYFAALLSGGWVESAGNVLSIHGFSYSVVHFALCYIYSGEIDIPENINIVELATLADYLCLEGLKEIVSSNLKTKYCHFFHKPCNVCCVGVLECLPIAINYGLDELHRKSLRWITKHFVRLWCTKAFASLPWELIDRCYNQHVVNMTVSCVFETLMNCDKLFSLIPQTRWAEPCYVVTKKLHDFCIKFLASHFVEFLKSDAFTSIACNRTWGIVILNEKTKHVCNKMRTDQLCQSYAYISGQHTIATATHENEELIELLCKVKNQVETALVKLALQASQCSAWFQMDPDLQTHIQNSAGLTFIPTEAKRRVDSLKPRQSGVASSGSRAVDLQQIKSVINRQHRQNNSRYSEPKETRQSVHQKQSNVQTRSSSAKQNGTQNKENKGYRNFATSSKSPYRNKYANVKSRYMEHKSDKSDRTASETTPSDTSETEKKSAVNKRPSKSLVSSVHMSSAVRQTARAVSLSKIPVSVRNSSQKRQESDKDTTSGSDNGLRNDRRKSNTNGSENVGIRSAKKFANAVSRSSMPPTDQLTATKKSYSGNSRLRNEDEKPAKNMNRSYTKTTQSASAKAKPQNRSRGSTRNENGLDKCMSVSTENNGSLLDTRSKDSSPTDTKCPSNPSSQNSLSEVAIARPNILFRRDGTFCIDGPTVLRKHSPTCEQPDVV